MDNRHSSTWNQRLELLRSIHLDGVAAEVNLKRLRDYQARLSCPTEQDRENLRRLVALYESGQLTDLPGYHRADGPRMRKILIALHTLIGEAREAALSYTQIASAAKLSKKSAQRGLDDLRAASLVNSTHRARPRWQGGQGPSAYFIVWSTLRDLASVQGLQRAFVFEAHQPVTAESSLPDHPSGRVDEADAVSQEREPRFRRSSPSRGHPRGHSGHARSHSDHPRVATHAGAPARALPPSPKEKEDDFFESKDSKNPPPPSFPPAFRARWPDVVTRLAAYGIATATAAARVASKGGWSIDQVMSLLDRCESMIVDGIQAFGPGLICRHLELTPPGTPIAVAPREVYVRAKRDHALRLQAEREAQAAKPAEAQSTAVVTCEEEWAALPAEVRAELIAAVSQLRGMLFQNLLRRLGENSGVVAAACMAEYRRRSSAPK